MEVAVLQAMMRHRGLPPLLLVVSEDEQGGGGGEEQEWRNDRGIVIRRVGDMDGAARRPEVEDFVQRLEEHEHGIMVVGHEGLTTQAAQFARGELDGRVEVFTITELQFDIMTHHLMPQYSIVAKIPPEAASIDALPVMLSTDPVARYLGLRPDALLKVVRPNASSGTDITYRRVVHAQ